MSRFQPGDRVYVEDGPRRMYGEVLESVDAIFGCIVVVCLPLLERKIRYVMESAVHPAEDLESAVFFACQP